MITTDDLFTPSQQTASDTLTDSVKIIPDASDENWVSYYKTALNFYSYWKLRIEFPYEKDKVDVQPLDSYLTNTVPEHIVSFLNIHCPVHSDVRASATATEKFIQIDYDFFADFFYNIPGWMHLMAFIYRLRIYLRKRYPQIVDTDKYRERILFYVVMDEQRNGIMEEKTNLMTDCFSWGHILDSLIHCDVEDMDTTQFRNDCRRCKFEVPGSVLYDLLTVNDPKWIADPIMSAQASMKGFVQAYTKLFGDLSYAILRSDEHPEPTPWITMHWIFRQINRNIKRCGKKPLPMGWLFQITGIQPQHILYVNDD